MKINILTTGLAALVFMTSCKSLKTLSSKDTSSTAQKQNTVRPDRRDVAFIDNIEVTPGNVVTSKHTTINTRTKKNTSNTSTTASTKKQGENRPEPNPNLSKADIEKADYLQLKYAVKLDATVEKLTNISLLELIDHWWGTRYSLGGTTESGIDCSAFTQVLMRELYNIALLRTAHEQYASTEHIKVDDLEEGDLVFFGHGGKKSSISHVGFYILNNKFVHASTSNGVMISDLNDSYWKQRFKGAGRVKKATTITD